MLILLNFEIYKIGVLNYMQYVKYLKPQTRFHVTLIQIVVGSMSILQSTTLKGAP